LDLEYCCGEETDVALFRLFDDSGTPQCGTKRPAGNTDGKTPVAVWNGENYFFFAWADRCGSGDRDILGQEWGLYDFPPHDDDLFRFGTMLVNWRSGKNARFPDVDVYDNDEYVVCWSEENKRLFASIIRPAECEVRRDIRVDEMDEKHTTPVVAVGRNRNMLFVWENSSRGVWCRLFDSAGDPLSESWVLDGLGLKPAVCVDIEGDFFLAWQSEGEVWGILLSGDLLDFSPFFRIADASEVATNAKVSVAARPCCGAEYVVSWDGPDKVIRGAVYER
jgi:hypothetical protein